MTTHANGAQARAAWLLVCLAAAASIVGCAVAAKPAHVGAATPTTSAAAPPSSMSTVEPTPTVQAVESMKGPARFAMSIAGIRAGSLQMSDITKRYGPGLFMPDEDHTGGRYYTDPGHTVTLHFEGGTDDVVDTLQISSGIALPAGISVADVPEMTTSAVSVPVKIDRGVALGMSTSDVLARLGKPTRDEINGAVRVLNYQADSQPEPIEGSYYYADFLFVNNRLRDVQISEGE